MSTDEFTKVTYKRKSKKPAVPVQQLANLSITLDIVDKDKTIRQILDAKREILSSDYYTNVQTSLNEALKAIQQSNSKETIPELVCFGIGHIANCMISRYQFALILLLKSTYHFIDMKLCDPVLSEGDITILGHFNIEIIKENIEAKYKTRDITLFYLPHCPKQLSNNLLWANWLKKLLGKCIIFSNSFHSLIVNNTENHMKENAEYVQKILPYVKEITIRNSFKYYEVFNDSSIHVFPNVEVITDEFWLDCKEPKYLEDIEYIEAKNDL